MSEVVSSFPMAGASKTATGMDGYKKDMFGYIIGYIYRTCDDHLYITIQATKKCSNSNVLRLNTPDNKIWQSGHNIECKMLATKKSVKSLNCVQYRILPP